MSRRLEMKNTMPIADRPAFYWPVMAGIESGCFDEIVITSEIPEYINRYKGHLPELAGVTVKLQRPSTVLGVTKDLIRDMGAWDARVSVALATAVLLSADDIRGVVALGETAPAYTVTATHDPQWARGAMDTGFRRWIRSVAASRGPWTVDAGEFYTIPPGQLRGIRDLGARGWLEYEKPSFRTTDIDNEADYRAAVALFDYGRATVPRFAGALPST